MTYFLNCCYDVQSKIQQQPLFEIFIQLKINATDQGNTHNAACNNHFIDKRESFIVSLIREGLLYWPNVEPAASQAGTSDEKERSPCNVHQSLATRRVMLFLTPRSLISVFSSQSILKRIPPPHPHIQKSYESIPRTSKVNPKRDHQIIIKQIFQNKKNKSKNWS